MLGLDCRKRSAVKAINVGSDLQLARAIDKGCLIGQVDPDLRWRQLNVLLGAAKLALYPFYRPTLVRTCNIEQDLGVFGRILHPHTTMAIGAEVKPKQLFVRSIVLKDREAIEKIEPKPSKRVPISRRLGDLDIATVIIHTQTHPIEHRRILGERRQIFVADD